MLKMCVLQNALQKSVKVRKECTPSITITDMLGKVLDIKNLIGENTIDLSGFANGIYFLKIENTVFKVIKQ
jgi:hypothetical protein